MKRIPLTQGKFTIVDDWNYERLNQWKWHVKKGVSTWYAERKGANGTIKMHRLIMNTPKGKDTDHKDGNGLNNKENNLRVCSRSLHHYNRKPKKGKYKGVSVSGRAGKFQARIKIKGKYLSLGYFKKKEDAAKAYDKEAKELFGEFARLNITERRNP